MLGRIGPAGKVLEVGSNMRFKPDTKGASYVGVNDKFFGDNAGSWRGSIAGGRVVPGKRADASKEDSPKEPIAFNISIPLTPEQAWKNADIDLSPGELVTISDDEDSEETKEDSVLEAATGRFYPSRRLKWHYRSEHGSLIAFSNHAFYDDQLTVFPSPFYDHPDYGVSLVQTGGVYDAGFNEIEGKAVVKAAVEFMKNQPDQSLGIVAVNAKQKDFIREQLDRETAVNENAAAYIQKWDPTLDALFVKNLENVQGDERDVIYISTVYGKDSKGAFHQRFGPINSIYGHRRLNVLFTRAKKKVTVFTSMIPEEIQDEAKNWGVKVLKGYLQFARDGFATMPVYGGECESEFEEWVLEVLRANGYQGVPQLGVCGYRIDIAVRNPAKAGVFLCGIECDGAMYHSARSVRERDRLRQEILVKYGWKLYRIWSTDWFRNPSLQTNRLLTYLRNLHPEIRETAS
jgi:very-short-patch-repair endonuclease